ERRHNDGSSSLAAFVRGDAPGWSQHFDIREQFGQRLIEAEVRNGSRNLSVLDEERAVTCESRDRYDARIQTSDVPEARDQYAALCRLDHFFDRCVAARHDEVRGVGLWRDSLLISPVTGVSEGFQNSLLDPDLAL